MMKRVDLFTPVHTEIRAHLFAAAMAAARIDVTSDRDVDLLAETIEKMVAFVEEHEHDEDAVIRPVLQDVDDVLAATVVITHDELGGALNEVSRAMRALGLAGSRARGVQRLKLVRAMNLLTAKYLAHAHDEETVVNAVLWGAFGDPDLLAIRERMTRPKERVLVMAKKAR
jgi:hypothetical protein